MVHAAHGRPAYAHLAVFIHLAVELGVIFLAAIFRANDQRDFLAGGITACGDQKTHILTLDAALEYALKVDVHPGRVHNFASHFWGFSGFDGRRARYCRCCRHCCCRLSAATQHRQRNSCQQTEMARAGVSHHVKVLAVQE